MVEPYEEDGRLCFMVTRDWLSTRDNMDGDSMFTYSNDSIPGFEIRAPHAVQIHLPRIPSSVMQDPIQNPPSKEGSFIVQSACTL